MRSPSNYYRNVQCTLAILALVFDNSLRVCVLRIKAFAGYSKYMSSKVLIADDHPLFRDALSSIVRSAIGAAHGDTNCQVFEATDYQETVKALNEDDFSIVFLDLNMPDSNGLSDLALLKKTHPQTPIVVVSAHDEPEVIRACLQHNASGYIIKSSSPESIKEAIQKVMAGDTYVPAGVSLDRNNDVPDLAQKLDSLTPSQLRVFIEMGKGKLNKQIAYDLDITEATVKAHITTVFKKLSINNRTQAVLLAQEHQARNPEFPQ